MKLYMQCGYGFMKLSELLSDKMPATTYILSPRDLPQKSQVSFSSRLRVKGQKVLFDPQLYAPHSEKRNFQSYDYWDCDFKTTDVHWSQIAEKLVALNARLKADAIILPGCPWQRVGRGAILQQEAILDAFSAYGEKKYATLCLQQNVLLDAAQIEKLLNVASAWSVDGFYVVTEHPDTDYFADSPIWMYNLLKLTIGLRMHGREVVIGYANHQQLLTACSCASAIAAGNWMNTRSFTFDKFRETMDIKRHKLWYYAPQAMTEFAPAYLDLAAKKGIIHLLSPQKAMPDSPAGNLFSDDVLSGRIMPSLVNYNHEMSFAHYLLALNRQCEDITACCDYASRRSRIIEMSNQAKELLQFFHKHRIIGQNRDYMEIFDVNDVALEMFHEEAGPLLSRMPRLFVD